MRNSMRVTDGSYRPRGEIEIIGIQYSHKYSCLAVLPITERGSYYNENIKITNLLYFFFQKAFQFYTVVILVKFSQITNEIYL